MKRMDGAPVSEEDRHADAARALETQALDGVGGEHAAHERNEGRLPP